jgi:hypothetical protein
MDQPSGNDEKATVGSSDASSDEEEEEEEEETDGGTLVGKTVPKMYVSLLSVIHLFLCSYPVLKLHTKIFISSF